MRLKWTYEACKEAALNFKTRGEFDKAHSGAYAAAVRKKWLKDICAHMTPVGDKYRRCVYAYEFIDNSAYVGLTKNIIDRHKQHMSEGKGYDTSVKKHMVKTGLTPQLRRLTDYISYDQAAKEEGNWVNEYKKNGWNILNQRPTGSLSLRKSIYTKDNCKKILLKSKFVHEVNSQHPNLLHRCKIHGWHKGLIARLTTKKNRNGYWTKERCASITRRYSCVVEFKKKQHLVYRIAANKGWLRDLTSHMRSTRREVGYWTKDRCLQESVKHKNRTALQKHVKSAYDSALKNGWLDLLYPKPNSYQSL